MVFERIREIICDQLDLEEDKVTMDSDIMEDFEADSLDKDEMACRFSTNLPRIARTAKDSVIETFFGCVALVKLFFFGGSLGFTEYSNI